MTLEQQKLNDVEDMAWLASAQHVEALKRNQRFKDLQRDALDLADANSGTITPRAIVIAYESPSGLSWGEGCWLVGPFSNKAEAEQYLESHPHPSGDYDAFVTTQDYFAEEGYGLQSPEWD